MGAIIKRHRDENGNPLYYITSSAAVGMSDGSGNLDSKLSILNNNITALKNGLGDFYLYGKKIESSDYASAVLGYKSEVSGKIIKVLFTTNRASVILETSNGTRQTLQTTSGYNEIDVDVSITAGAIVAIGGLSYKNTPNGSYGLDGTLQGYEVDLRFVVLVGNEKYVLLDKYEKEVTPIVETLPKDIANINNFISGTSSLLGSYYLNGKSVESEQYAGETLGYKSELTGSIVQLIFKTNKNSMSFNVGGRIYKVSTEIGDNVINVDIPVNEGEIISSSWLAYISKQDGCYNSSGVLRPYEVYLSFIVRTGDLAFVDKKQYSKEVTPIVGEYADYGKTVSENKFAAMVLGYKSDITGYVRRIKFTTNTASSNKQIYVGGTPYYIGNVIAGENNIEVNIAINKGDVLAIANLSYTNGSCFDKDGKPQSFDVSLEFKVYVEGKEGEIINIKDKLTVVDKSILKNSYNILRGCLISILGDSISTFNGVTDGYTTYYPTGDVLTVEDTYWGALAQTLGGVINVNAAFAGSGITTTASNGAFMPRAEKLGNPDIILLHGGTNDHQAVQGEYDYSDTEEESAEFRPAFARLINKLQKTYPYSFIVVIISENLGKEYSESERVICEHYGVQYVDMSDPNKETTVVAHPNKAGMGKIHQAILDNIDFASNLRKAFWGGSKSFTKDARPRSVGCKIGNNIFDTTLGKPIWYKGNKEWVDATGQVVENPSGYR